MKRGATLVALVLALLPPAPTQAQDLRQGTINPFTGSVPKGEVTGTPIALSVKEAMQRALEANLGLLLQEEAEATAHGARWRALADLLPDVSGSLGPRRRSRDRG
jgi:hypothetical protein